MDSERKSSPESKAVNVDKDSGKKGSLIKAFAVIFLIYSILMLAANGIFTYFNQRASYQKDCQNNLKYITNSLNIQLSQLSEYDTEFQDLKEYFEANYQDIIISPDFQKTFDNDKAEFIRAFNQNYPTKVLGNDIAFKDMDENIQMLYFRYRFEYWMMAFDHARDNYGLQYTYFIYPVEGDHMMCYMLDIEHEELEKDGKMCLNLGVTVPQDPAKFSRMWEAWESGTNPSGFDEFNNDFGHGYTYYSPLNINGEKIGLVCADISVKNVNDTIVRAVLSQLLGTFALIVISSAAILYFIRRKFLERIVSLEEFVNDYSINKSVALADKIEKADSGNDEIGSLSIQFAGMIREMEAYMVNLQKITAEKERIGAELNVATNIQASMLPSIFPPFPDRHEFDLYASMDPAKEVGGDFYDFFFVDKDHLGLVIADVSGKGIPAALFMVISKTLIKNNMLSGNRPAEACYNANMQLCEGNGSEMFVTAWVGLYDINTGEVVFSDAGHEYPLLLHGNGEIEIIKPLKKKPPLSTLEGIKYIESNMKLQEGDTLFLYTDGVPEATNSQNELYGMDRLTAIMGKLNGEIPDKLLPDVRKDVDAFVGDSPQFDDLTMLAIKINQLPGNDS